MSTFSIGDGRGREFAEVEVLRLTGQKGLGFHRLIAALRFDIRALDPQRGLEAAWLDSFALEVLVGHVPLGWLRLKPGQPQAQTQASDRWKLHTSSYLDLSPRQLMSLEDARAGRDLQVTLQVGASVSTEQIRGFAISAEHSYSITQSDWIRVLGEMGYRQAALIELDVEATLPPQFAGAIDELRSAEQRILRGEFREAVRDCRVALDRVGAALGDAKAQLEPDPHARTKYQRYLAVRRAVRGLASPAHHGDANAATVEYMRSDAIALLTITSGLLRALEGADSRP